MTLRCMTSPLCDVTLAHNRLNPRRNVRHPSQPSLESAKHMERRFCLSTISRGHDGSLFGLGNSTCNVIMCFISTLPLNWLLRIIRNCAQAAIKNIMRLLIYESKVFMAAGSYLNINNRRPAKIGFCFNCLRHECANGAAIVSTPQRTLQTQGPRGAKKTWQQAHTRGDNLLLIIYFPRANLPFTHARRFPQLSSRWYDISAPSFFTKLFFLSLSNGKLCMFIRCMSFKLRQQKREKIVENKLIIKINCALHVQQVYVVVRSSSYLCCFWEAKHMEKGKLH